MKCATITRALVVRLCFACHGLISICLLYTFTNRSTHWYLATALAGLFLESMVTLIKKSGHEWKWLCPSVIFYLLSVIPAIWCFEMELFDLRELANERCLQTTLHLNRTADNETVKNYNKLYKCSYYTTLELKNNPFLKDENSSAGLDEMEKCVRISEQLLLLLLILGRWFLPKGKLSHDQLSQLLLVYLGTAADIAEFFEAFKEKAVQKNRILCVMILGMWSSSLLQFSFVLTAAKARKEQGGLLKELSTKEDCCKQYNRTNNTNYLSIVSIKTDHGENCWTKFSRFCNWFSADIFGIFISIFLQDGPFLAFRLVLIFRYGVVSYTNMFFTAKNSLIIILLIYRLIVIWYEQIKNIEIQEESEKSKTQIVLKRVNKFCQNGLISIETNTETDREVLSGFQGRYACSDHNNHTRTSFYDLETGLVIKSDIKNNLYTIPLPDENKLISSSIIEVENLLKAKTLHPILHTSFQEIQNVSFESHCLSNVPQSSSSLQTLSLKEPNNVCHLLDKSSKISQEIESICNDSQIFLSKHNLKSSINNLKNTF